MGIEKGLWCWCLVLWLSPLLRNGALSSELDYEFCTSRCGNFTNISYPFRLRDDPVDCGHPDYELTCENDVPLIHVSNGTYRVLGINYKNFTIRLVDPGIQEGNCSSLPLYSLSLFDFDNGNSRNPYRAYVVHSNKTESLLFGQVGYMKCSDAVREDAVYVNAAPCVKEGGHLYAVVGNLLAHQFKPHCRLKSMILIAADRESVVPGGIKSYADIHTLLSSGFELS